MIGLSLSPRMLAGAGGSEKENALLDYYGGTDALLSRMRELGVTHIELRSAPPSIDPGLLSAAVGALSRAGLGMTVHGALPKAAESFSESYKNLLPHIKDGEPAMMTLHSRIGRPAGEQAAAEETTELLSRWCGEAAGGIPVRFALELNRRKGEPDPSVSCGSVLFMLRGLPAEHIGACWDFGHYYHNMALQDGTPGLLPPGDFISRTVHTHIHALGPGGTHTPFFPGSKLPLGRYVSALKRAGYAGIYNLELKRAGYAGIYNLELSFERFPEGRPELMLEASVKRLADALRGEGKSL